VAFQHEVLERWRCIWLEVRLDPGFRRAVKTWEPDHVRLRCAVIIPPCCSHRSAWAHWLRIPPIFHTTQYALKENVIPVLPVLRGPSG
jgi:hypothetical protein